MQYVYIELKTSLPSSSIPAVANYREDRYCLLGVDSGESILTLPPEIQEIRPGSVLYEDEAILVRT
jgi:hypothetical protein